MRNILIIGGSKGIGNAVLQQQLERNNVFNISRTEPDLAHSNLTHFSLNILQKIFSLKSVTNADLS